MLTGRTATAADRLAALATRLEQLEDRLRRLESGHLPSAEDLSAARGFAEQQQARALEAQLTYDRLRSTNSQHTPTAETATAVVADNAREPSAAIGQRIRADVSADDQPADWYWRAIMDQVRRTGWRDWSGAFCRAATAALPSVRGVAISVFIDRLPTPIATSDAWSARLDEAERVLGEGPATVASASTRPLITRLDDPSNDTWIAWTRAAVDCGAREVWSFPHHYPGLGWGAVTFYRSSVTPAPDDRRRASLLSGLAGRALGADAGRIGQSEPRLPDPVDVATGVLAARLQASPADAYARIRAHAFVAGKALSTIAHEVISGTLQLD